MARSPKDRLAPCVKALLQLRMNRFGGVVDPCPLSVLARAQASGNELLPHTSTLNGLPHGRFDQAGKGLAITKHALGCLTQFGLDAKGRRRFS